MNNKFKLTSVAALFLMFLVFPVHAQVRGNGNVVTQDRPVSGVHSVKISGGIDLVIGQSDAEQLSITTDENLQEYIRTEINNGELRIWTEKNIWGSKELRANLTIKKIKSVSVSGGGDIESEGVIKSDALSLNISGGGDMEFNTKADNLSCNVSGGGDAELYVKADNLAFNLSGGGDLELSGVTGNLAANISGGGDAEIKLDEGGQNIKIDLNGGGDLEGSIQCENIMMSVSGGGNVELKGKCVSMMMDIRGGGDVSASSFLAENVKLKVGGGSDVDVYASGELDVDVSGGGTVYYRGNPHKTNFNASGGSEIKSRD